MSHPKNELILFFFASVIVYVATQAWFWDMWWTKSVVAFPILTSDSHGNVEGSRSFESFSNDHSLPAVDAIWLWCITESRCQDSVAYNPRDDTLVLIGILQLVCEELELSDLEELHSRLQLQRVSVDAFPKLEALATQIADIIEPSILRQQQQSGSKHRIWCSKHWKSVINRLEHWRQQIQQLPVSRCLCQLIPVPFLPPLHEIIPYFRNCLSSPTNSSGSLTSQMMPCPRLRQWQRWSQH